MKDVRQETRDNAGWDFALCAPFTLWPMEQKSLGIFPELRSFIGRAIGWSLMLALWGAVLLVTPVVAQDLPDERDYAFSRAVIIMKSGQKLTGPVFIMPLPEPGSVSEEEAETTGLKPEITRYVVLEKPKKEGKLKRCVKGCAFAVRHPIQASRATGAYMVRKADAVGQNIPPGVMRFAEFTGHAMGAAAGARIMITGAK